MAEDERYPDASLPLPPGVGESFCRYGGSERSIEQMPDDSALQGLSGVHRAPADPLRPERAE
ncbi:hypothetical protein FGU65_06220 [Methanoculleus sp. FWC-SCC1]|uniref:Uncharacterized protein n=1 Tax=Methanoculleus frigidifontis TaxID=2584085 RepID=A0ABT8M970_9EURY|nr:hypothetical protein [Methanoculleus sp. FWC-SCC1]MDN7024487.1 hypothetical protein [Methanoculleus sp. FWC-SCC1]